MRSIAIAAALTVFAFCSAIGAAEFSPSDHYYMGERLTSVTVHVDGEIVAGDQERLVEILGAVDGFEAGFWDGATVLSLNSPGGSYHEGIEIGRMVREKGIGTRVPSGAGCYSACAIIFMHGTGKADGEEWLNRKLHPTGRLGFEALRDQIEVQLAMLKRQGLIDAWHDRRIGAGQQLDASIGDELIAANIILLLVSPDFLASDYCYDREMEVAMERHERGEATVIPVILRPCDWHPAPFGKLRATPADGKPITQWPDRDLAMLDVSKDIRRAAEKIRQPEAISGEGKPRPASPVVREEPRSSNLGLAKTFTDRDKDRFKSETLDYIAKYFENSLDELGRRNDGVDGDFRRVDANRFTAAVYRHGKAVSRCTVYMGGGHFSDGISYVDGETMSSNTMNESLSVQADGRSLFLRSLGMHSYGRRDDEHLSMEGGAELFWSMFIQRLQQESY